MRMPLIAAVGLALLCCSGLTARAAAAEQTAPNRWAVLVGVNDYAELEDLEFCRKDAEALQEQLIQAGFAKGNVFLLADGAKEQKYLPFKANIQRQLEGVLQLAERGDLVLVTFSGHGVHVEGKSYLCPSEARLRAPAATMIPLDFIYQQLKSCKAGRKLLWVDACRNDPRPRGSRDAAAHQRSVAGFGRSLMEPPEGILALSSCKPGQVSWEDAKLGHGVFMHYILEGLAGQADRDRETGNRNDRVSLLELYNYANLNTKRFVFRTRNFVQTPVLWGEITGDFDIAQAGLPSHTNSIGMKLKLIPAGEFMMGSPKSEEGRESDEGPQHRVRITRPFYLGVYEVTQQEYERVTGKSPSTYEGDPRRPVEWVSWGDAQEFCRRLSALPEEKAAGHVYRLPTEAEWEYACRAGSTTRFCFGDSDTKLGDYAWFRENSGIPTHPVGQKKPNAWGLYDMHGNVYEWCADWHEADYYGKSPPVDPKGPSSGIVRVLRGGCFALGPGYARSACRRFFEPDFLLFLFGFRIARTP